MPSEGTQKAAETLRQRHTSAKNKRNKSNHNSAVTVDKTQLQELSKKSVKLQCRKVIKALAKVFALSLVNSVILLFGAYIFLKLESHNEIENCITARDEYLALKNKTLNRMKLDAEELHGGDVTDEAIAELSEMYQVYARDFAENVVRIGYNPTHNCANLGGNASWTFSNSLIFALTVITTIGYGVIAPATDYGKLICMAYAVVGIPIFLLALANIGDVLAREFKKGYWLVCCCGCFKKKQKPLANIAIEDDKRRSSGSKSSAVSQAEDSDEDEHEEMTEEDISKITIPLSITITVLAFCGFIGGAMFVALEEGWTFLNSVYFSFITISTIGFGDEVPTFDLTISGHLAKLIVMVTYITVGMAAVSMCFQLMADEIVAKLEWISVKCGSNKDSTEESFD